MSDVMRMLLQELSFDEHGLVATVAQQHDSGEVLMLAWMNRQAMEETLRTGRVHYWSRARGSSGARAKARARCSAWSSCASIATATRCCCWSTSTASPAIPGSAAASSAPRARTALVEIAGSGGDARRALREETERCAWSSP